MNTEIELLWRELDKEVIHLCGRWKLYNQLFTNKEDIALLNRSGSYVFFQLRKLITDYVFLTLSKLTDPAKQGKNENTSIRSLLERTESTIDRESLNTYQAQVEKLEEVCKSMRIHRNKCIAHSDINLAFKTNTDWLPPVTHGDIDDAIIILRQMMRAIMQKLFESDSDYDPDFAYGSGGNHLLYILRKAHYGNSSIPDTEDVV